MAESSSSTMNRKDDDYCLQSLSLEEKKKLSAHQVALSNLEFEKQFLILSYCGNPIIFHGILWVVSLRHIAAAERIEDVITVDAIRSLENLPMVLFETELWRLLGCKCIQDIDRAKGSYLQPGKTHLQRVLRDENVLLVKFANSSGLDGNETTVRCSSSTCFFSRIGKESIRGSGSNSAYHRIIREGILVGLRRYNFFVFKDNSKKEKKKENTDSTFSSVWSVIVGRTAVSSVE